MCRNVWDDVTMTVKLNRFLLPGGGIPVRNTRKYKIPRSTNDQEVRDTRKDVLLGVRRYQEVREVHRVGCHLG